MLDFSDLAAAYIGECGIMVALVNDYVEQFAKKVVDE